MTDVASPPRAARGPRDLKRTLIIIGGLVIAANFAIVGLFATRNTTSTPDLPSGLAELFPARGQVYTPQAALGVQLEKGWSGELTLDSTPLPKDQYDPDGLANGAVFWRPGPGKEFIQTPSGKHTMTVHFWPTAQGPGGPDDKTFTWDFKIG